MKVMAKQNTSILIHKWLQVSLSFLLYFSGLARETHKLSGFWKTMIEVQCQCSSSTRQVDVSKQTETRHSEHTPPYYLSPLVFAGLSLHVQLSCGLQITSH